METLVKKHRMYISQVSMDIVRERINDINWEKPLVAIKGVDSNVDFPQIVIEKGATKRGTQR